jgi:hypothetical protein
VIVDPDGMANTQGPQGRISNFRPVNSRMEQHGASHGHNSTNTELTYAEAVRIKTALEAHNCLIRNGGDPTNDLVKVDIKKK